MTWAKIIKRRYLLDIYANIRWITFFDIFYRIVSAYKSKIKTVLRPRFFFFFHIYGHIYILFYYNTNTSVLFLTSHAWSFVNRIYPVVITHTWPTRRNPILTGTITIFHVSKRALPNDMRTFSYRSIHGLRTIKLYLHLLHWTVATRNDRINPINYFHKRIASRCKRSVPSIIANETTGFIDTVSRIRPIS